MAALHTKTPAIRAMLAMTARPDIDRFFMRSSLSNVRLIKAIERMKRLEPAGLMKRFEPSEAVERIERFEHSY